MKTVLALDLEGTLISNAVSQFPRPGLRHFLDQVNNHFPRIVIFTAVREEVFRSIARELVCTGDVPDWFAGLEYVKWDGSKKDLRFIENSSIDEVLLLDDYEGYVLEEQRQHWVAIPKFESPYASDDCELTRILQELTTLQRT